MNEIVVAGQFGRICMSPEDGTKLCTMIRESLERKEPVTLDFAGVTTLATVFLNAAIGSLYASFDKDFLDANLNWKGIDLLDESAIRLVQRSAIRFYTAEQPEQDALVSAFSRSAQVQE